MSSSLTLVASLHRQAKRPASASSSAGAGYEPTVTVVVSSAERLSFETLTFTS